MNKLKLSTNQPSRCLTNPLLTKGVSWPPAHLLTVIFKKTRNTIISIYRSYNIYPKLRATWYNYASQWAKNCAITVSADPTACIRGPSAVQWGDLLYMSCWPLPQRIALKAAVSGAPQLWRHNKYLMAPNWPLVTPLFLKNVTPLTYMHLPPSFTYTAKLHAQMSSYQNIHCPAIYTYIMGWLSTLQITWPSCFITIIQSFSPHYNDDDFHSEQKDISFSTNDNKVFQHSMWLNHQLKLSIEGYTRNYVPHGHGPIASLILYVRLCVLCSFITGPGPQEWSFKLYAKYS